MEDCALGGSEEEVILQLNKSLKNLESVNKSKEFTKTTPNGSHLLVYHKLDNEYEHVEVTTKNSLVPFLTSWLRMYSQITKQRFLWPNHIEEFSDSSDEDVTEDPGATNVSEAMSSDSGRELDGGLLLDVHGMSYVLTEIPLGENGERIAIDTEDGDESDWLRAIALNCDVCRFVSHGGDDEDDMYIGECAPGCFNFCHLDWLGQFFDDCWYKTFQWIFHHVRKSKEILKKEHCELVMKDTLVACTHIRRELLTLQNTINVEQAKNYEMVDICLRHGVEHLLVEGNVTKALLHKNKATMAHDTALRYRELKSELIELLYHLTTFESTLGVYATSIAVYFKDCNNKRYSILRNIKEGDDYFKRELSKLKTNCQNFMTQCVYETSSTNASTPLNQAVNGEAIDLLSRNEYKRCIMDATANYYKDHAAFDAIKELLNEWLNSNQ